MEKVKVVVIGAGIVGFSTAVCIAESIPGCSVTVLAERFTPNTTSDRAAGILFPQQFPDTPLYRQKRWFKDTFEHLFEICNSSEAAAAGVYLLSGWQIFKEVPTEKYPYWSDVVLSFRFMTESELKKFPQYKFGQAITTLKCESPLYLLWLEKRLKNKGGEVYAGKVEDFWELYGRYDIVVNCSGLGSRQLAGDFKVYPVKGQIEKVHAPWLKHFIRDGNGLAYIYPGIDSVSLGGTRQQNNWSLSVDPADSKDIFDKCYALEPSLKKSSKLGAWVGLRPMISGLRLEKEVLMRGGRQLPVVHNYGHGGSGISIHWGTAKEAAELVSECIKAMNPKARL
ncbi:D-aspartate oxidase [Latimeria chalumnae]|uniref:D-aspartate oxidase n=1 Tax=Latimeria chalumnae TaxID=7897 RepID=H3AMM3_LATCH|nr:PREDICTED: D-aspartate oxidase [Latimeria chalumnae]XP_014350069.1 PREDICTED: D-aspartate oxidase [Latimeria chalumnae]XP_014350070.1 PREDICTED: D-aspartate oxidase [Latimeria chalumnae]XP_014350071.1 PREDICTED: D-aspartate oxidase [Latimeria chalumnae]XP_014350072.1 PREDICTED: D-aspartate oxidase [Latimeria chalumnae]|eukprot:XP_006006107.1 PREDICTED: D-aspartate oxidase [Latimeria chalumnae]